MIDEINQDTMMIISSDPLIAIPCDCELSLGAFAQALQRPTKEQEAAWASYGLKNTAYNQRMNLLLDNQGSPYSLLHIGRALHRVFKGMGDGDRRVALATCFGASALKFTAALVDAVERAKGKPGLSEEEHECYPSSA